MRHLFVFAAAALILGACGCAARSPSQPREFLPKPLPPVPPLKPMPIDAGLQAQAKAEVLATLKSSDPVLRAHALEVVKTANLPDAGTLIIAAMDDPSPLVRKAAALAAGELRVTAAKDRLLGALDQAKTPQRMATIFALHRLGDTEYSHEFESTAADPSPYVRADTAFMLGLLGEKSATPILRHMMDKDPDPSVRLEAAAALWRMDDESGLDDLVGATISIYPDDQKIALFALASPRDTRVLGHIEGQLTNDDLGVALVAARAAGVLASDDGYGVALQGASRPSVV